MIDPDDFRSEFSGELVRFPVAAVSSLPLSPDDTAWLTKVGLPESCAPFLNFGGKSEITIPTLGDLWGAPDGPRYRVIGSNGNGDPVAIDTGKNCEIVFLNHDNDFERIFINSSIRCLAGCVSAFARLISQAQAANGEDAYLDGNIPQHDLQAFIRALQQIDPPSLTSGMWADELEQLRERRA